MQKMSNSKKQNKTKKWQESKMGRWGKRQGLIQDFLLGGGKSNSDLIVVFFFVLAILIR